MKAVKAGHGKIQGFGHRVYKTGDPRAAYLRTLCGELAAETGNQDMEAMADTIETIVRTTTLMAFRSYKFCA